MNETSTINYVTGKYADSQGNLSLNMSKLDGLMKSLCGMLRADDNNDWSVSERIITILYKILTTTNENDVASSPMLNVPGFLPTVRELWQLSRNDLACRGALVGMNKGFSGGYIGLAAYYDSYVNDPSTKLEDPEGEKKLAREAYKNARDFCRKHRFT